MGETAEKEWFYLTLGHRRGPVTFEEFCEKITKEEIYVESTQVWKQGMKQWVNLTDAKPFDATIKKIRNVATQSNARIKNVGESTDIDEDLVCRGASRALFNMYFYVGWLVPVLLGVILVAELQVQQLLTPTRANTSLFFKMLPLLILAISSWQIAATRMRHAGYSKAHGLGLFVPLYNLWVLMVCLFAPRNYGRRKKLGVGALFYIVLLCVSVGGSVVLLAPKVGVKNLSPVVMVEDLSDYYKGKTNFTSRYNSNAAKAASSKARKEQMQQNN